MVFAAGPAVVIATLFGFPEAKRHEIDVRGPCLGTTFWDPMSFEQWASFQGSPLATCPNTEVNSFQEDQAYNMPISF